MTQKELLTYAIIDIRIRIDHTQKIIDRQIENTGGADSYTEERLEKLWKRFFELEEMEKELEDKEKR